MNTIIGQVISKRYKIVALAGQGGMGKAYKAISCLAPADTVAIKLISHHSDLWKVDELHRFQTEASHLSKLYHRNIVSFHEFGILDQNLAVDGFSYYLVMDWVEGKSLNHYIKKKENDLCFFFELGTQIALALDYTHRKNIIHRDLKPSNIMIRKSVSSRRGFEAIILDFGIARLRQAMQFTGSIGENFKGDMIGTPLYMSPEQTGFNNLPLDHRTDLYSLGCILFEILAGRPPFFRGGRVQILKEHARSLPPSIKTLIPNIPNDVDYVISKLLAKNPDDRYQTGMQLYLDLKYLQNQPAIILKESAIHTSLILSSENVEKDAKINDVQKNSILSAITAHKEDDTRGMLISIQSEGGGGKTTLLQDLQKELKSEDINFISGEFLDYASSLPLQVISSAFNDYVIHLESSQIDIERLCLEIKKRIGGEVSLLCTLVPMLRKYFPNDNLHSLSFLTESENFQTLVKVFADFLKCIGIDKKKLVFMFDDLHKADDFSIKLLDIFVSYTNTLNFILVITYHPYFLFRKPQVSEFLKKVQRLKRRFLPIVIKPLTVNESKKFLANKINLDVFSLNLDRVFELTKGNPRHLTSFWTSLLNNTNFTMENDTLKASYNLETVFAKTRVSSIEQCFQLLESYDADEWLVIEILSIFGINFCDPLTLARKFIDGKLLEKTIQRMEDDGLLKKIQEGDLGETSSCYQFAHYHLRQFFYNQLDLDFKNKVHLTMLNHFLGGKDSSKQENLSAAIYHGLALGTKIEQLSPIQKERLCKAFCNLGDIWKQEKSYLRAEVAYQNSLEISEKFGELNSPLRCGIILSLCDLWFRMQQWDEIIFLGEKSIDHGIAAEYIAELQKNYLIPAYLIQGQYRKVAKLGVLRVEKRRLFSQSLRYSLLIKFLKDMYFMKGENFLVQSLLRSVKNISNFSASLDQDSLHFDLWWLQTLQEIYLDSKLLNWLPFHLAALKYIKKDFPDSLLIARLLTFRAVLWSHNNQYERAEKILSLLVDLSYSMDNKLMIGHTNLIKGLTIDYDLNHYGDLKLHLQEGLQYLKPIDHPTLVPKAICLRAFLFVLAGKFSDAEEILKANMEDRKGGLVTKILCGAFQLFVYFIQGRRDLLVFWGERYIQECKSLIDTGSFETYFLIISIFIEYAKGDVHKTRSYFFKISKNFSEEINRPFLFTFERDFISLIMFSFPMIFEQEHQRNLMRKKEMRKLLKSLKSRVLNKKPGQRDIFFLLKARVLTDLGDRSGKKLFDKALKIAFMLGNDLITCFIYLWYGQNLEDLGTKKQDYISKAYKLACDKKFHMLQSYIESLIKSEPTFYDKKILNTTFIETSLPFNTFPTSLALNHLAYVSKSYVDGSAYVHSLNKSLGLLKESYKPVQICIVLANHGDEEVILFPQKNLEKSDHKDLLTHLWSFLSLPESSFLPSAALPFSLMHGKLGHDGQLEASDSTITNLNEVQIDLLQGAEQTTSGSQTLISSEMQLIPESQGFFDAYVPIASSSGTLGILLMRQVPECYSQKQMKMSTDELDLFGAQLGLVIERDFYSKQTTPYSERWTNHLIEKVPWLRLWTAGALPNSQISAWSMGLAMPEDQYLIVFSTLQGGERTERQHISSMIWHHTMVMQVLLKSPDSPVNIEYFRNQFASLLRATPGSDSLGDIALAFTLVTKGSRRLVSGHFGHARPLVLGANNQVKPFNDPVMSYDNGRELRFWEVLSSWEDGLPLLLCAESTRYIDSMKHHIKISEEVPSQVMTRQEEKFSVDNFFAEGSTPPYYVAVLPNFKGGY